MQGPVYQNSIAVVGLSGGLMHSLYLLLSRWFSRVVLFEGFDGILQPLGLENHDIVVLAMNERQSLRFLKSFRERCSCQNIPVICVATHETNEVATLLESGANDVITYPCDDWQIYYRVCSKICLKKIQEESTLVENQELMRS